VHRRSPEQLLRFQRLRDPPGRIRCRLGFHRRHVRGIALVDIGPCGRVVPRVERAVGEAPGRGEIPERGVVTIPPVPNDSSSVPGSGAAGGTGQAARLSTMAPAAAQYDGPDVAYAWYFRFRSFSIARSSSCCSNRSNIASPLRRRPGCRQRAIPPFPWPG